MRTVTSVQGTLRRLAILGASLALAACGSSQNWNDDSEYVTVSGTVSGFSGGTLALWNNGGDTTAATGCRSPQTARSPFRCRSPTAAATR